MFHENTPLAQRLAGILRTLTTDGWAMINSVDSLALNHGNDVYDEFFYVLTRKRFGAEAALQHWKNIVSHVTSVITPRYHHQGFLPAVLHYMQREGNIMSDPRLLEADFIRNIQRSSITDGLTALYNQTFFKINLSKMIYQARRHDVPPFAIVLFDLDHFKHYNDSCGHLAGDLALKRVAEIILQNIRESDIAARYGGEEFALLLPKATRVYAATVAQRIRRAVEAELFPGQKLLPSGNLTISGGFAECPLDAEDADALIESADAELYKAKARRNCISPTDNDRRSCFRRPVRSLVEFSPYPDDGYRPGISLDVSEFGMAVGCDMSFAVGSAIHLRVNRPFWNNDVTLSGMVRQANKLGDMNFIGVEFEHSIVGDVAAHLSPFDRHKNKI